MKAISLVVLLLAAGPATIAAPAQTTGRPNPPLALASVEGRDVFEFYCSACHGRDARGGGPAAAALKTAPPDLTRLSARHGGDYPRARLEAYITRDGQAWPPAHGSGDMPIWGPVFYGLDPSDTRAKIRVANVIRYIESIQVK